jgi:hypothetical protein
MAPVNGMHECALCGLPAARVARLVAGDRAAVCDGCVVQAHAMLVSDGAIAAPAPPPQGPQAALRSTIAALPRDTDIAIYHQLAAIGVSLANGEAAQLRILGFELMSKYAVEHALEAWARIAPFERLVQDDIADATGRLLLGDPRGALAALDGLVRGPRAAAMTPAHRSTEVLLRASARVMASSLGEADLRAADAELAALGPRFATLVTDARYANWLVHETLRVRARIALARRDAPAALALLVPHLAAQHNDAAALGIAADAYQRSGDYASSEAARAKALARVPRGGRYAERVAGRMLVG